MEERQVQTSFLLIVLVILAVAAFSGYLQNQEQTGLATLRSNRMVLPTQPKEIAQPAKTEGTSGSALTLFEKTRPTWTWPGAKTPKFPKSGGNRGPLGTGGLVFSSFVGGAGEDSVRDIATDKQGNIYVVGGTASSDFKTTPGAFDTSFNGWHDAFVMKLDPQGSLLWSTYVGGPNYDRAYAVEVDDQGYVYIAGRAGLGFPVTPNAFLTTFQGGNGGAYGDEDGFICKVKPDGSGLVFCSYFGDRNSDGIRDLAIDPHGDIYIYISCSGTLTNPPGCNYPPQISNAFQGKYKTSPQKSDVVIAKIASDGSRVLQATYLGGSEEEAGEGSLRVDASGSVYMLTMTTSLDAATPNAYQKTYKGNIDFLLARLTPDFTKLIFSTYLGGSDLDMLETHEFAIDKLGNAYVASATLSTDIRTTSGALQPAYGGSGGSGTGFNTNYPGDTIVMKISPDGSQLLASTYLGGRYGEGNEGIATDSQGNVYLSGATYSDNFKTTTNAVQQQLKGSVGSDNADYYAAILSSDLTQILYATYLGGTTTDFGRTSTVDKDGNLLVGGLTFSSDFPKQNYFKDYGGGQDGTISKIDFTATGPRLDAIVPNMIYNNKQQVIAVQGAGFGPTLTVLVNGVPYAKEFVFPADNTLINMFIPQGVPVNVYNIQVQASTQTSQALPLTVIQSGGAAAPPAIIAPLMPSSFSFGKDQIITINGNNFDMFAAIVVNDNYFYSFDAISHVSPNVIRMFIPQGASRGTYKIQVMNLDFQLSNPAYVQIT